MMEYSYNDTIKTLEEFINIYKYINIDPNKKKNIKKIKKILNGVIERDPKYILIRDDLE